MTHPRPALLPLLLSLAFAGCRSPAVNGPGDSGDTGPTDTGPTDTGPTDTGNSEPSFQAGTLGGCVGTDDPEILDRGYILDEEVEGTVVEGDGAAVDWTLTRGWSCDDDPEPSLVVETAEGWLWWFAVVGEDPDGAIDIPEPAPVDASVSVFFSQDVNESGDYFGLTVHSDGALVFAAEDADLDSEDLPEMTVEPGEVLAETEGECGTQTWYETVFQADDSLSLVPGESGTLQVGGETRSVRAVDHYAWTTMQCTDLGASRAWFLWREAER